MAQRSMYELLNGVNSAGNPDLAEDAANPDAVIAKQRFVYNGVGKHYDRDFPWDLGGTGTVTMDDNGLKLYSSSGNKYMSFGNKRPFSKTGCSMIWSSAQIGEGGSRYEGLINTIDSYAANLAMMFIHGSGSNFTTADNSGSAGTNSADNNAGGMFVDVFTTWKIEQNNESATCSINNKLSVTRTDRLTTLDLQPFSTRYAGAGSTSIRYVEVWNH